MLWTNQTDPLGQAMRLAMQSSPHPFSSLAHIEIEVGRGGGRGDCRWLFVLSLVCRRHPPAATYLSHVALFRSVSLLSVHRHPTLPNRRTDPTLPCPSLPHGERAQTKRRSSAGRHPLLGFFLSFCVFFFCGAGWEAVWLVFGVFVLGWGHIVCPCLPVSIRSACRVACDLTVEFDSRARRGARRPRDGCCGLWALFFFSFFIRFSCELFVSSCPATWDGIVWRRFWYGLSLHVWREVWGSRGYCSQGTHSDRGLMAWAVWMVRVRER